MDRDEALWRFLDDRRTRMTRERRRRRALAGGCALLAGIVGAIGGLWVGRPTDTAPHQIASASAQAGADRVASVTPKVSGRARSPIDGRTAAPDRSVGIAPSKLAAPAVVQRPIVFGAERRAEMAAYSRIHYGSAEATWVLRPKVIVEHFTAGTSFVSAWNTFASNSPDAELGQLPGTCAHFVIDTEGTIYQLVPTAIRCRHTVGLNHVAIGIEHVGTSDAQILANPRQLAASLRLTRWLMSRFGIALANVIGHNESLSSPYHRELYRPWAHQTHGDWIRADMDIYRRALRIR